MSIHKSDCDCHSKRFERELEAWRTSEFDDSGTASGISRGRLNEIQDRSWTGSRVDGLEGSAQCMGCKHFSSERTWEIRHIVLSGARTALEKLCHLETCAWDETVQRMEPHRI